mgnify:CR=1 FL=1
MLQERTADLGIPVLADLPVQRPQRLEHAVVEVAAVHEGRDQGAQLQRAQLLLPSLLLKKS